MSIDLSKLTEWHLLSDPTGEPYIGGPGGYPILLPEDDRPQCQEAIRFAMLARQAFEVMMRRGWIVEPCGWGDNPRSRWCVRHPISEQRMAPLEELDPFSALVESDRWYKQNVEKLP